MHVSLIVPVFNAELTLRPLCESIRRVALRSHVEFELVFVDDASTDSSLEVLREIAANSANVVVIANAVNRGQSASTLSGIAASRNDIVVTMDDDLKHRPEDVPAMLTLLQGARPNSLVMGVFARQRALWRTLAGIGANAISNLFLHKPLPLRASTFCAFDKRLCSDFDSRKKQDVAWMTALVQAAEQTITIPVQSGSDRLASQYTLAALFHLFLSRSASYRLFRVLFWLGFCGLAVVTVTLLFLSSRSYGSLILGVLWVTLSGAISLLLMVLARRQR